MCNAIPQLTEQQLQNFWQKVNKDSPNGCWIWMGAKNNMGYGVVRLRPSPKMHYAHRVSFALQFGEPQQSVLHRCDVPLCVNPNHLFAGNQKQNLQDMRIKNRAKHFRGEQAPSAKLTETQVREIRTLPNTRAEIARAYGISWDAVNGVISGRYWKHIA